MEMITISLCLITILALMFLKQTADKVNQPPSPWRLPVIGNLHQLSLHPHRGLRSLSLRYGPLMLLHFGRVPVLVVSSSDVAHDVMKTHDLKVTNRPQSKVVETILNGGRDVAFSPYGEYWRQIKSVCVIHLLSNKMVRSFENVRGEEINLMMEKVEKASSKSSPLNLSELLITLTRDVTSRIAFGRKHTKEESMMDFKDQVRKILELVGGFPVGEYIPTLAWIDRIRGLNEKAEEVSKTFGDFMDKVVQDHLDSDKPIMDLVDILLSFETQKRTGIEIRRSDIKFIILDMFLGGTSTTSTLLEWTMTELIRHPECMKKLQEKIRGDATKLNLYTSQDEVEDMKYLKAVIKEVLRLHPPLPLLIPRLLNEDIKLKGYDIASGTQVIINAWAIQRDIVTWGMDAEEFRPERHLDSSHLDFRGTNFKMIPFGSGRRICPGIGFALALVEVTLANLVNRFNWRMDARLSGDGYDLAEATGIDVCRRFPLIVVPSMAYFSPHVCKLDKREETNQKNKMLK